MKIEIMAVVFKPVFFSENENENFFYFFLNFFQAKGPEIFERRFEKLRFTFFLKEN